MARILFLLLFPLTLLLAGCAFNRADFVSGPNGTPNSSEMSSDGKTLGSLLRDGLHARVSY